MFLEIHDLKKSFGSGNNRTEVLKGIEFTANKGEICVLLGPSGSGKSTFLRCLNLLEVPTGGQILFEGTDITDPKVDINRHRQKIGMVFQQFNLFPHYTVKENIMLAPVELKKMTKEEAAEKGLELLRRVGLEDKAKVYPPQLSGGQKQRVAIAGVVAMEPKCIVFDEPTAMLDPNGRKEVIATAHDLNKKKGVTIILITHYMEEVIDADQVFVMDEGHVVMHGTPKEIFSRVDELKKYRMDVPQVTMLADALIQKGVPLPKGILRREELVDALCQLN